MLRGVQGAFGGVFRRFLDVRRCLWGVCAVFAGVWEGFGGVQRMLFLHKCAARWSAALSSPPQTPIHLFPIDSYMDVQRRGQQPSAVLVRSPSTCSRQVPAWMCSFSLAPSAQNSQSFLQGLRHKMLNISPMQNGQGYLLPLVRNTKPFPKRFGFSKTGYFFLTRCLFVNSWPGIRPAGWVAGRPAS